MAYADRVWLRASSNLFFAADNSLTQGDQSGRFAGVQQMNTAFADRFAFVVPFSYLDMDVEAQALMQHTGCTRLLADHVVSILSICRAKVDAGDIIDPPSIRQAIAFIQACAVLPVDEAWQVCIAARQPAESQVGLGAVYASAVSVSLIEREA
jgi:MoxR-like ATPase